MKFGIISYYIKYKIMGINEQNADLPASRFLIILLHTGQESVRSRSSLIPGVRSEVITSGRGATVGCILN